jgi:transketolase
MRFTSVKLIYEAALKDKNIYFLTADLGHFGESEFASNIPKQYINVGIAEQNMIGIAAGLALRGKKVFVYSITPFVTLRCLEQIKNDICYQNLDVTIIGVGGGLVYGPYGNTHCSIEDIAVLRVLPNMKIVCPANPQDTQVLMSQLLKRKGPTYIRIGRGKEPMPQVKFNVKFGKGYILKPGKDITLFSTGTILTEVEKAALIIEKERKGLSVEIIHLHTVKPLDNKLVIERISKRKAIFTIEEHNIIGGLGGAIAELICEYSSKKIIFKRIGIHDIYLEEIGSQEYLRNRHGISAKKIANQILKLL